MLGTATLLFAVWAVVGDVYTYVLHWEVPAFSPRDYLTIAGFVLLLAGYVLIGRRRAGGISVDLTIDTVAFVAAVATAGVVLLLLPVFRSPAEHGGLFGGFTLAVDVTELAILARLTMIPGRRPRALVLLMAALSFAVTGELVFYLGLAPDWFMTTNLVHGFYILFFTLMAVAALHPSMTAVGERAVEQDAGISPTRLVSLGLAVVIGPITHLLAEGSSPVVTLFLTVVLPTVITVVLLVRIFVLVRENNAAREAAQWLAFHDPLTGLANRALFGDRIDMALRRLQRSGAPVGVLFFDLDDFKAVNDGLGHAAGDAVLREVGHRLTAAVRAGDTPARLGGDEFALLVEGVSPENLRRMGEHLLEVLRRPIAHHGTDIVIEASIGASTTADRDATVESLLRDADVAMYAAKAAGKGTVEVFVPHLHDEEMRHLHLRTEVRAAAESEAFELRYRPTVLLATGELVGLQAQVWWPRSEGPLPWSEVAPITEDIGMVVPIGRWVLREACTQAAAWGRASGRELSVTVAVSEAHLSSDGLVEDVGTALAQTGLPADRLVLEVVEDALVAHVGTAADHLRRLHAMGVRIAVDGFTGLSSLDYLRHVPVDVVTLDRSLVARLGSTAEARAEIRVLLELGRSLHLDTVADGVTGTAQVAWLREDGCRLGRGPFFGSPTAADEIVTLSGREAVGQSAG
jgi:diguanylate cyclase (GGDEF)-like protein